MQAFLCGQLFTQPRRKDGVSSNEIRFLRLSSKIPHWPCFLPPHTQDRGRMTRFMSVTLVLPLPSFDHWMYPRRPGRESTESANLGKKNRSRLAIPLSFSLPSLSNHISPSPDPFLLGIYNAWMDGRTDGWMHGQMNNVQSFPVLEVTPTSTLQFLWSGDRTQLSLKQDGKCNLWIWRKLIEKAPT